MGRLQFRVSRERTKNNKASIDFNRKEILRALFFTETRSADDTTSLTFVQTLLGKKVTFFRTNWCFIIFALQSGDRD